VKHGIVSPYPAQNVLTPEQQELLRGRYQGAAPDTFPVYQPAQPAVMADSAAAPADSAAVPDRATAAGAPAAPATPAPATPPVPPSSGRMP
jgi:hypothetical protein